MLKENKRRWIRRADSLCPSLLCSSNSISPPAPALSDDLTTPFALLLLLLCTILESSFAMLSRVLPDNAPPWLRSSPLNNLDIDFQLLRNRLMRSYSSIINSNVALSDEPVGPYSGNRISNLTFYDLKSAWT